MTKITKIAIKIYLKIRHANNYLSVTKEYIKKWSGRGDLNPRRPAWEAGILPLNYARIQYKL